MPFDDFATFEFPDAGESRQVFHTGAGPGVVILHELPGLTEETFELGRRVAARGFSVFLPLLFGEAGQPPAMGPVAMPRMLRRVCLSREFRCFAAHESSPVTDWLRALCREVHARCGGPGVGAIGMCFTGGFVISMMLEPSLMAPVTCQPSLPLPPARGRRAALGVSPEDLRQAAARAEAEDLTLLGMRFESDRICPKERFDTLQREFGSHFERVELPAPRGFLGRPKHRHSVLIYHYDDTPGHPTREAFERMIALFEQQLEP